MGLLSHLEDLSGIQEKIKPAFDHIYIFVRKATHL